MTKVSVLMTALVPTIGHSALIEYARQFVSTQTDYDDGFVEVIISGRSFEPTDVRLRAKAFREHFGRSTNISIVTHFDDDAPQNPSTEKEWEYWTQLMSKSGRPDFVVSSETYGAELAKRIPGCKFVPYDLKRFSIPARGTTIRNDMLDRFSEILPVFQKQLAIKVTAFGQESVGKSTLVSGMFSLAFRVTEWARPYLENLDDPSVTKEKMDMIAAGQYAMQKAAYANSTKPIIAQDTDLLSTIGYYRLAGMELHPKIIEWFKETKSDLYFLMPDDIPFEPDILRYGGDKRETIMEYWRDLLEEFDCRYVIVQGESADSKALFAEREAIKLFNRKNAEIINFERD